MNEPILQTPTPATKRFLTSLIDYAGLFPPASLDLETALANYARYRQGQDAWMLSRFIIPVSRLADVTAAMMAPFSAEMPLHFSLLSRDLVADTPIVQSFCRAHGAAVTVSAIETRLPADATHAAERLRINTDCLRAADWHARIFYELPQLTFDAAWDARLAETMRLLSDHNQAALNQTSLPNAVVPDAVVLDAVAFKLRCGGVEATLFPTPEQVARAILAARDAAVMLKYTAGLHHPVRHFNQSVNTKMHGFLNVFIGGILAHAYQLDHAALTAIIAEEDPAAFALNATDVRWRDLSAPTETIDQIRTNHLVSVGSCSFDEPRDDLQTLRFLA